MLWRHGDGLMWVGEMCVREGDYVKPGRTLHARSALECSVSHPPVIVLQLLVNLVKLLYQMQNLVSSKSISLTPR